MLAKRIFDNAKCRLMTVLLLLLLVLVCVLVKVIMLVVIVTGKCHVGIMNALM